MRNWYKRNAIWLPWGALGLCLVVSMRVAGEPVPTIIATLIQFAPLCITAILTTVNLRLATEQSRRIDALEHLARERVTL